MSLIYLPCVAGPLAGGPADPFFSQVILLAHFDGTNGSTTFVNSAASGFAITQNGTSSLSTTKQKFGPTSMRIPTTTASYMGTAQLAALQMGTSDFTIEGWFNLDTGSSGAIQVLCDLRKGGVPSSTSPEIYVTSAGGINYFSNALDRITSSAGAIASTTWNHVAYSRIGTSGKLFLNGTQVGSTFTDNLNYNAAAQCTIGCAETAGNGSIGYFDEWRITKGTGRYSTTFTPTGPFPNH